MKPLGRVKKLLLADDSVTIQRVIELTFSDDAFEVVTVGDGCLALEKLEDVRPDIVLCDVIMPEIDGYEVCRRIKSNPAFSQVPVLLLTGAFEPLDEEKAARVGADGFVAKPFDPDTLIVRVRGLLGLPSGHTSETLPTGGGGIDRAAEFGGAFGSPPAAAAAATDLERTDLEDDALTDIFRDFQKGVEKQLGTEDYETHFNLGIAYKEMDLLDEAIAEFELAAKDESRLLECASMLGICYLQKRMPKLAVKWFEKGLQVTGGSEEEHLELRYGLASARKASGEADNALELRGQAGHDLSPVETESLIRLGGLIVRVAKAFRAWQGKLTAGDRDEILRALKQSKEAIAEGRVADFEECRQRLEGAARLLDQTPNTH
jgi:CheY-like chemotaxis protein